MKILQSHSGGTVDRFMLKGRLSACVRGLPNQDLNQPRIVSNRCYHKDVRLLRLSDASLEAEQLLPGVNCHSGEPIDVLGLGQAMVDLSAAVADDLLATLRVQKGARKIISVEERTDIMQLMDSDSYQVSAGGSLSNSLMALSRLGAAASKGGGRPLNVSLAGLVGSDPLGTYYMAQMLQAGVQVISEPVEGANTGTVVVLTSSDAQRTMLSYLGTSCEVPVDARLKAAIARSRMLVIEGYLWELPNAATAINTAIKVAKAHGTLVVMTAGDAGVIERHHQEIWRAIDQGIDMLFTNRSEAEALGQSAPGTSEAASSRSAVMADAAHLSAAEAAALYLGPHCPLVCVTDGSHGSVITAMGQLYTVPPHWQPAKPVDTCGAGDAYAAGLLYGFLSGWDIPSMGRTGAKTASAVISHMGSALTDDQANALVDGFSTLHGQQFTDSWAQAPAEMP